MPSKRGSGSRCTYTLHSAAVSVEEMFNLWAEPRWGPGPYILIKSHNTMTVTTQGSVGFQVFSCRDAAYQYYIRSRDLLHQYPETSRHVTSCIHSWRVLRYDPGRGQFLITDRFDSVWPRHKEDWMSPYSIIVDCIYAALSGGTKWRLSGCSCVRIAGRYVVVLCLKENGLYSSCMWKMEEQV